ncbi:MAG: 4-(cytidine 5'-diphospho)-2-C-methyl-D-erythritol kinase [Candidatus Marinimicrobia bacterium]|nr:4-(cytidine 5'-diphospho)-2-C-methyl-D-erythritol kinase [Candidatus Neomarinimicrobiota bacterium]
MSYEYSGSIQYSKPPHSELRTPNSSKPLNELMITLTSHAKINLGLHILGRRPEDGYHLLETIFQEVDFADEIQIEELNVTGLFKDRFTLTCDNENIPTDESNLILKAIWAMIVYLPENFGAKIHLIKHIPSGAGLGGGSSNAATILRWLNKVAKLNENELATIAVKLGADVPFFLKGGTQYAKGIGEKLSPIKIPLNWCAVLVFPNLHISTSWAYEQLKISLTAKLKKAIIPSQLEKEFNWRIFENDFDEAIIPSYPEIGKIKERLYNEGAFFAGLSGSGSTVFGICESCDIAKRIRSAFENAVTVNPI